MYTTVANDDEILQHFASRLTAAHEQLASAWLARLNAILPVDPDRVFPTHRLLDHIPELIREIAAYLPTPAEQGIASNTAVMTKAEELGLLRFEQQASVHQVLREYQLFGDVLDEFFRDETIRLGTAASARGAVLAMSRVHQAVRVLEQQTVDALVRRYTEAIERQNERLRSFSRMLSHEIRQPLSVLQLVAGTLRLPDDADSTRILQMMGRNVGRLGEIANKLERLVRLTRKPENVPNEQLVQLTPVARDVAGQLAEMAAARDVQIAVADDLPALVADAGRVELVLVNLIANAIKYSDPDKAERRVFVERHDGPGAAALRVRDNGIGIPAEKLSVIFDQFVRVHEDRDEELGAQGMGLGLSIVRECMDAMDGTVTVESREGRGTAFSLAWPARAARP